MRVLNIINGFDGCQTGLEYGFEQLKKARVITDVYNFYYTPHIEKKGLENTLQHIINIASSCKADLIIIYHIAKLKIPPEFYTEIKTLPTNPILIYDEHDGYERFKKPLTKEAKIAMSHAHIISLCGLGSMVKLIPKKDRKKIIYTPAQIVLKPLDYEWTPTLTREFDVIVIGNRIDSKIPYKRLSGAKQREDLIRILGEVFQDRFALYGRGWDGFIGNKGPLDYYKQLEAIRNSWISVGYDHCTSISYYFSGRLPISMFAGVAHLCHYRPGYEQLFSNGRDLVWFHTIDEAIDSLKMMLSLGSDYLNRLGLQGRNKSISLFSPEVVLSNLIKSAKKTRMEKI